MTVISGSYRDALARGTELYPGTRIGRPGRARTYWATIAAMRLLRLHWRVRVEGADRVGSGAGILVGNHISMLDPALAVASRWWRVTAFTKVEAFESPGGMFFRLMGQIPLRRGDEACTTWAMEMAARTLADGSKIGLYPEGTRSPDPARMHRLHKRVLVPLLQANPDAPVHAISTTYGDFRWGRRDVTIRLSDALPIDATVMTPDEMTDLIRDALLGLSGQTYVHAYARDVKRATSKHT